MKNLLILLLTTFALSCCNKDDETKPKTELEKLPPATQTGANTAGCLINGEVFIPHQEGLSPSLQCNYEYIDGEFYFNIAFSDSRNGGVKSVSVNHNRVTLHSGNIYTLNKNTVNDGDFTGGGGTYFPTLQNFYRTNTLKTGELKITRLDLSNSIISGTFWFDAVNAAGDKVEIRQGRFDMHY
jgi:hypothetical protein